MFGDMGHGFLMFCFALWMVLKEKQLAKWNTENEVNTSVTHEVLCKTYLMNDIYKGLMKMTTIFSSERISDTHYSILFRGIQVKQYDNQMSKLLSDVGNVVWRTLPSSFDVIVFHLLRSHIQRLFFEVFEFIWIQVARSVRVSCFIQVSECTNRYNYKATLFSVRLFSSSE